MLEWNGPLSEGADFRWLIVRHGQPNADAIGRCYGKLDVPLSDAGREQIERLRPVLSSTNVSAVSCSPRRRARESAELLAPALACTVEIEEGFAELDFGDFEGRLYDEIKRAAPDFYRRWMAQPTSVRFPGGESFSTMRQRVLAAERRQRTRNPGQTRLMVTHGGVGRIVVADALRMAGRNVFRLGQSYAGLTAIEYFGDYPVVRVLNWTPARNLKR